MKFVADSMLGKLARWLRILGYDTRYDPYADDDALLAQSAAEDRVLLTRDRPLVGRAEDGRAILIDSGQLDDQMAQLVRAVGLDLDRDTFTRCLLCNEPIVDVSPQEVKGRVPPYVYKTQTRFHVCPNCDRVYWRGTHLDRMAERLTQIRVKALEGREREGYR